MPKRYSATGPDKLLLWPAHPRRAFRCGLALLIGLTALDAAGARLPQVCLLEPGVAQSGPRLSAAAATAVPASIIPLEAPSLRSVKHALRVISGLLIETSQQTKAVTVRVSTIIGFRG